MIDSWDTFCSFFALGFGLGVSVGLLCLGVRRVRLTMVDSFRRSMFS